MRCLSNPDVRANSFKNAFNIGLLFALVSCPTLGSEPVLAPPQMPEASLARPLPAVDVLLYQRIFDRIDLADLGAVSALIAALEDRRLLPDVEARALLASGPASPWHRWSGWLAQNRDHPLAWQVYRRAQGIRPAAATMPTVPARPVAQSSFGFGDEDIAWRGRSFGNGWHTGLSAWQGGRIDAALYPLLPWVPATGYRVNRAILASIARIESGFDPKARNPSGAAGLMQLMPATARAMGAQAGLPATDRHLVDPSANLGLAQHYLDLLLGHERIRGNLLHMAVAYNLGVAGMGRVQDRMSGPDPLLAIELLPNAENRLFAQRVLATFWIYQMRLAQTPFSLDDLAQGRWPTYGQDDDQGELAQYHERN